MNILVTQGPRAGVEDRRHLWNRTQHTGADRLVTTAGNGDSAFLRCVRGTVGKGLFS